MLGILGSVYYIRNFIERLVRKFKQNCFLLKFKHTSIQEHWLFFHEGMKRRFLNCRLFFKQIVLHFFPGNGNLSGQRSKKSIRTICLHTHFQGSSKPPAAYLAARPQYFSTFKRLLKISVT